ncbi:MAG: hypothetical protein OEM97_01975 [Acidimicrobiia bacterium]|nr:hypothetical protein [Acidimicrobiia bacterium]
MADIYVPTEYALTHKQFLAAEPNIEVLIGGQSDVKAALAPPLIDAAAFNYADTGESPIESYFKLKHHLPRMPKLRVLIYSLSLPSFVGIRKERLYGRMYRRGQLSRADYPALREIGVASPIRDHIGALLKFTGKPELFRMRQNLIRKLSRKSPLPPAKGELVRGFRYQEGSKVEPRMALRMAEHHFKGDPLDPVLIDYFEQLLHLCRDNKVTVVTVSPPVTDIYLAAAEKYVTRADLFAATVDNPRFDGLIHKHIDMTDMYATRYELFRDQNHMNASGAELASRHVASVLGDLVHPEATGLTHPNVHNRQR